MSGPRPSPQEPRGWPEDATVWCHCDRPIAERTYAVEDENGQLVEVGTRVRELEAEIKRLRAQLEHANRVVASFEAEVERLASRNGWALATSLEAQVDEARGEAARAREERDQQWSERRRWRDKAFDAVRERVAALTERDAAREELAEAEERFTGEAAQIAACVALCASDRVNDAYDAAKRGESDAELVIVNAVLGAAWLAARTGEK